MNKKTLCGIFAILLMFAPQLTLAQEDEDFSEEELMLEDEFADEALADEPKQPSKANKNNKAESFDDADFGDDEKELSFDDFENDTPKKEKAVKEDADSGEDLNLEPLKDEGEITTEVPIEEVQPKKQEPPTPPAVAPAPTPEPEPAEPVVSEVKTPEPVTDDEPDLVYESRLHDIFVNFHSSKTSEAQWSALVGDRESETYQIQNGDTLWGVSKTFFSDGNYWPKIWAINNKITNPHLIEPGHSIRFLLGTEAEPPAFTVTETGEQGDSDAIELKLAKNSTESGSVVDDGSTIEIPPPLEESRPVLMRIPPSLPQWQNNNQTGNYDDVGIDYGRRPILDVKNEAYMASFINDTPLAQDGKIEEIEVGGSVAADWQYIYVSLNKGVGQVGERYFVYRNAGALEKVNHTIDDKALGQRIDILGEITLRDVAQGKVGPDQELWRAIVDKSIGAVSMGSFIKKGQLTRFNLDDNGPRSNVVAQIIGGPLDNRQRIFAQQSVTFLNRGTDDGLSEGQVLPVRSNQVLRNPKTIVEENIRAIGYLKVIRTTPKFSTAVVVRSFSEIMTGDLTGQGTLLSRQGVDSSEEDTKFIDDVEEQNDSPGEQESEKELDEWESPEGE